MTAPSSRPSRLPRVLGAVAAGLTLILYGVLLFLVPSVLDWAFDEGGSAPKLVAVVGAALTMGTYFAVEGVARRLLG